MISMLSTTKHSYKQSYKYSQRTTIYQRLSPRWGKNLKICLISRLPKFTIVGSPLNRRSGSRQPSNKHLDVCGHVSATKYTDKLWWCKAQHILRPYSLDGDARHYFMALALSAGISLATFTRCRYSVAVSSFYRAILCISGCYAVARCPSVCLSHTGIVYIIKLIFTTG